MDYIGYIRNDEEDDGEGPCLDWGFPGGGGGGGKNYKKKKTEKKKKKKKKGVDWGGGGGGGGGGVGGGGGGDWGQHYTPIFITYFFMTLAY